MTTDESSHASGQQMSIDDSRVSVQDASQFVSERYTELHAEATAMSGAEGQVHLRHGYNGALDQGYRIIDKRRAELGIATNSANGVEAMNSDDAIDEPRSVKRHKMKPADLEEKRINGRVPSLTFGAALNKVPAPISTKAMPMEPNADPGERRDIGDPTIPSITEHLVRLTAPDTARGSVGYGRDLQLAQSQLRHETDPFDTNPYKDKADEIGLAHGFAGKGLLEDELIPFGWREGDPPINHTEAHLLFDHSRDQQKEILKQEFVRTQYINTPEQVAANKQRDERWTHAYNFDKFILRKRKEIYNTYLQRQVDKQYEKQVNELHDVLHLPSGVPTFISPGVLDPQVVLSSFKSCYTRYLANKEKISRWNDANEYLMTSFNTVYGNVLETVNHPCNPEPRSLSNGAHGLPSLEVPDLPGHAAPEPQPRGSSFGLDVNGRPLKSPVPTFPLPATQARGLPNDRRTLTIPRSHDLHAPSFSDEHVEGHNSFEAPHDQSANNQLGPEYPTPTMASFAGEFLGSSLRSKQDAESRPSTPRAKRGRPRKGSTPTSRKVSTPISKNATPVSKQRVLKPQPPKSQPWYQAQLEAADLPTHLPSKEFMEEAIREAETKKGKQTAAIPQQPTPSKRRRKRSPIDAKKGIVVSTATAAALHKAGAPWTNAPTQAPQAQSFTASGQAAEDAPHSQGSIALSGSRASTEPSRAPTVSASSYVSMSNTTSELSSLEDPEDDTFVPSGKRKTAASPSVAKRSKKGEQKL